MTSSPHASAALSAQTARPPVFAEGLSLGAHVDACRNALGRGFAWRCAGEHLHDLLGPRLVTTVFVATTLMVLLAGCA